MIIFIAKAGWLIPGGTVLYAINRGLYDYIIIFATFGETTFGKPTFSETPVNRIITKHGLGL